MPPIVRLIAGLVAAAAAFFIGWAAIALGVASLSYMFVFGDSTWPAWAEPAIMTIAVIGGIVLAALAGWRVWIWRKPAGVDG